MKNTSRKCLFLCIVILLFAASGWIQSQDAAQGVRPRLETAAKKDAVDKIAEMLEDNYVYPDKGEEMALVIRKKFGQGGYDSFTMPASLASRLQGDLREICQDRHLRVRFDPETAAALLRGGGDSAELQRRRVERERRVNFGFEKIERDLAVKK